MNADDMAQWIARSQHVKPGNPMPSFDRLEDRRLSARAAYLVSLR
jgi:cytochrome c oxidase subunit 2